MSLYPLSESDDKGLTQKKSDEANILKDNLSCQMPFKKEVKDVNVYNCRNWN